MNIHDAIPGSVDLGDGIDIHNAAELIAARTNFCALMLAWMICAAIAELIQGASA